MGKSGNLQRKTDPYDIKQPIVDIRCQKSYETYNYKIQSSQPLYNLIQPAMCLFSIRRDPTNDSLTEKIRLANQWVVSKHMPAKLCS